MGDYFIYLLRLASNMHHHFISFIEDLWLGYCERASQESNYPLSKSYGRCSSRENSSMLCGSSTERNLNQHVDIYICRSLSLSLKASHSFCQGLILPSHALKLGFRLLSNFLKGSYNYVKQMVSKIRGFLNCLGITLQGSSNDIGWLQKCDEFPPVEDGTTLFMELLNNIRHQWRKMHGS